MRLGGCVGGAWYPAGRSGLPRGGVAGGGILQPPLPLPSMLRLLLALVVTAGPAAAQTQQVLFPDESGATLLASLRAAYKPAAGQLQSEGQTKDLMMYPIWTVDEGSGIGVRDVYTGWFVPFQNDPPGNANQEVFLGGAGSGLNQEHVWPRSRLNGSSSATSERDLHHLFPARVDVNGDRGSLPFAEIDDTRTTTWYADGVETSTAPADDRALYSEISGSAFEPRESVKGEIARAMFYVAAMYPDEADLGWFDGQDETLYGWHYLDPADADEAARSAAIAAVQGGDRRENPFVLDSTLARRAFFPEIVFIASDDAPPAGLALRLDGPTPFRDRTRLTLLLDTPTAVRAALVDALGRTVAVLFDGTAAGSLGLDVEGRALAPGVYTVRVAGGSDVRTQRVVRVR